MSKVIKLKQSDIENIVKNIIKEAPEFDDFDTQIGPEELPGADDPDMNDPAFHEDPKTGEKYYEDDSKEPSDSVVVVMDPNTGKKYVIDADNERILGITM